MVEGTNTLRCRNCAGAIPALAAFCGHCGISRAQALGSEPIPANRVIGPNHPTYIANEAARAASTPAAPEAAPTVEAAPEQPKVRRTFSLDEVEQQARLREEQLQQEREARERAERERREREEQERKERQEEQERARREQQERARLAVLRAHDNAIAAKEQRMRRLRPVGMALTAVSLLAVIWVAGQWNAFRAQTPEALVQQYAAAVASHDVKALAENTDLFPRAAGTTVVLPAKFQRSNLPKGETWTANVDWNNWTGRGTAILTFGDRGYTIELGGSASWDGIFRSQSWHVNSWAPTLLLDTAAATESGPMTLNGLPLGRNSRDGSSGLVGETLLVFPGSFDLRTASYGYVNGQAKAADLAATGKAVLKLAAPTYGVPSKVRDAALKSMLKAARTCANKSCSHMPYFSDDDFGLTEPWYYEYVSSRRTAYAITGCTIDSSNANSATTATVTGTCNLVAARAVRWITYSDSWSGYYRYYDDSGATSDSVSLRASVSVNPKTGALSIKALKWA